MTKVVRAKFRVDVITKQAWSRWNPETKQHDPSEVHTVKMNPVYSDKPGTENKAFWDATPSGSLELGCVHKEVLEHLSIGDEVYLDITVAPKESK